MRRPSKQASNSHTSKLDPPKSAEFGYRVSRPEKRSVLYHTSVSGWPLPLAPFREH